MNQSLCEAGGKISNQKNILNNLESHDNNDLLIQIQMRDKELKYLHDLLEMKDTMISLLKQKQLNSTLKSPSPPTPPASKSPSKYKN